MYGHADVTRTFSGKFGLQQSFSGVLIKIVFRRAGYALIVWLYFYFLFIRNVIRLHLFTKLW
jgi:hypothetical protein